MEKIKIDCTNGERFTIKLPKPANIDSFYAFSMHKAGSTLMNLMLSDFCREFDIPVVSPFDAAWSSGVRTQFIGPGIANVLKPRGYAYIGFRHFLPLDLDVDLKGPKKVFLVRDPRDMLTSLYFSVRYSHAQPKKAGSVTKGMQKSREHSSKQDINEFVLERADFYIKRYERYKNHLFSLPNIKIYRYEDVIFDKENWLFSMLSYFGILHNLPPRKVRRRIREIARRHDIRPSQEDDSKHIRQVTPGNYKKHLSEETINALNIKLCDFLKEFNYPSDDNNSRFIFLHIPKCAGQAFARLLCNKVNPDQILHVWSKQAGAKFEPDDLCNLKPEELACYKVIHGHIRFVHVKHLVKSSYSKNHQLITIVREPLTRAISLYWYIKRTPRHPQYDEVNNASFSYFLNNIVIPNVQCQYLGGVDAESSISNLTNHFHSFCPMEHLSEYAELLSLKFPSLSDYELEEVNAGSKTNASLDISDDDKKIFYEQNAEDKKLYEWVLQHWQKIYRENK